MAPFKLYYEPAFSGSANFIVASLGQLDFDSEQVDVMAKKTASGADYRTINPKGNVPAIVFPDDRPILAENVATLTFLADQNAATGLSPAEGTARRYEYLNAMGFINSELHPRIAALFFTAGMSEEAIAKIREAAIKSAKRFADLILEGKDFCLKGNKPTAADIYAYVTFSWKSYFDLDLSSIPAIAAFSDRVKNLPGVAEAHAKMIAAKA